MKFEIFDMRGFCAMTTTSVESIPFENLDIMAAAGYKFKVDGKVVAKSNVKSAVESSLGHSVDLRAKSNNTKPIEDLPKAEDITDTSLKKPTRKVRCLENNKIYNTQSEAARDLGIDPAQVSDSVKSGRPRSGYTFERIYE